MPQAGIFAILGHATFTVKCVLALLVCMSLMSWSVILFKIVVLNQARIRARKDYAKFVMAQTLSEAMTALGRDYSSPLYGAGTMAMDELKRLEKVKLLDAAHSPIVIENLGRALRQGVSAQLGKFSRSLPFLATCGNSAPFIGLFGTVWGIMHAFHSIGQMKTAALAAVAPGISEALIATAVGLAVAIPASIAYNVFLGMLQTVERELVNFTGAFLNTVQRELSGEEAPKAENPMLKGMDNGL
ncbi:MotA/TolQ/ExbB proton channel family protein [Desulfobaculum bizertense]|uniref:Cell division and transport-associated protein TolQ (TC 2.C.1.2.1) n=1 Tax=Desulfobaculum bizertense DSM 18034 TaxID=1121442 RepID=A0A1T4VNM5_9BACT|nr:MotA/TolQ/ExbB proton channel family protein [Desulfobaculum bizertense]UIJ38121.1 MotA/TolQ/ExbB proton channel family protein [Desulfobaculum bizertense]SKA66458.1 Cell division and transport-associated protein TolQ (TC 2.C.1.2.1) [Desulfobaculum bizertense DSM 18034]